MYAKIFESIYDGTLAEDWRALITFQQMLILCDRDGLIDMTPSAISRRTGIPIEHIKAGIEILESDDPLSRSDVDDGRRVRRVDPDRPWGWVIVNYSYYRNLVSRDDKLIKDRDRIAGKREQGRLSQPVAKSRKQSLEVVKVAQAKATTEVKRKEGADAPADDPKDLVWRIGVGLGIARGVLGKLCKEHGTEPVAKAVIETERIKPADPKSYLFGLLSTPDPARGAI